MRWLTAALLLAGCNQVFGLPETKLQNTVDAPFQCPAIGTPPEFSDVLRQLDIGNCYDYHPRSESGTAVAMCYVNGLADIHYGPIDGTLEIARGLESEDQVKLFARPRLLPNGDMLVYWNDYSLEGIARYHREVDGAWYLAEQVTSLTDLYSSGMSTVTADSRIVIHMNQDLHEL